MTININGTTGISGVDGSASTPALQGSDTNTGISFGTDEVAINTGGTARATVDSSGRLLVGTSTVLNFPNRASTAIGPSFVVAGTNAGSASAGVSAFYTDTSFAPMFTLAKSNNASVGSHTTVANDTALGELNFAGSNGSVFLTAASITSFVDGAVSGGGANDMPGRLVFSTTADGASSPTERMRITQAGALFTFNSTGTSHEIRTALGAGTSDNYILGAYGATANSGGGTASFVVRTNGNVENTNNSYGALSDIKLKENIVDANSQWDDIKALRPVNYNFKEGQTHTQIGLVAQEVELVSPGLVTESTDRDAEGNDLGTVTKSVNYSVLYMKAVKALQEAMERIETLEAEVQALKGGN